MGRPAIPMADRFWPRVDRKGPDECWNWKAQIDRHGYGIIHPGVLEKGPSSIPASRASWIINCGPIPDGLFVLHHCDNRACVNPAHLFLGSAGDNTRDMVAKGRGWWPHGESHYNTLLKVKDVKEIRRRYANGEKQADIARDYGIKSAGISHIITGRRWASVTKGSQVEDG